MPRRTVSPPNTIKKKANAAVQLFDFDADLIDLEASGAGRRPKRKLKAVARFDSLQFDARPSVRCRQGSGFPCPDCRSTCSYDSRVCDECHLACYYEAGVGVVTLKERSGVVSSAKSPREKNGDAETARPVRRRGGGRQRGKIGARGKSHAAIGGKFKSTTVAAVSSRTRKSTIETRGSEQNSRRGVDDPLAESSTSAQSARDLQQSTFPTAKDITQMSNEDADSRQTRERGDGTRASSIPPYESEPPSTSKKVGRTLDKSQPHHITPSRMAMDQMGTVQHVASGATTTTSDLQRVRRQNAGLHDENSDLEDENRALRAELRAAHARISGLVAQVSSLAEEREAWTGGAGPGVAPGIAAPTTAPAKSGARAPKSSPGKRAPESRTSGRKTPRKRKAVETKTRPPQDKAPQDKRRKSEAADAPPLFAFDAAATHAGASAGAGRPRRRPKAAVRFAAQRFDGPGAPRQGRGFACPDCAAPCDYASRACGTCGLECYYEAGVGVLTQGARRARGEEGNAEAGRGAPRRERRARRSQASVRPDERDV